MPWWSNLQSGQADRTRPPEENDRADGVNLRLWDPIASLMPNSLLAVATRAGRLQCLTMSSEVSILV